MGVHTTLPATDKRMKLLFYGRKNETTRILKIVYDISRILPYLGLT